MTNPKKSLAGGRYRVWQFQDGEVELLDLHAATLTEARERAISLAVANAKEGWQREDTMTIVEVEAEYSLDLTPTWTKLDAVKSAKKVGKREAQERAQYAKLKEKYG